MYLKKFSSSSHAFYQTYAEEYLYLSTLKCALHPVALVFTSPPYEKARQYEGIKLPYTNSTEWANWCSRIFHRAYQLCHGLTAFVVEGTTKKFEWSASPIELMHSLKQKGVKLRKPPIFHRNGIPGSGGPDWLRNDYEFIVCASHGKLPWSDNTACGKPPKYPRGGDLSHRKKDDMRVKKTSPLPEKANPGNVIHCKVGKGHMGSDLAHKNEAPFPEQLAEFFIKSFCPPGGTVLDLFSGSGTTAAVAAKLGRNSISVDIRESQRLLWEDRLEESRKKRPH